MVKWGTTAQYNKSGKYCWEVIFCKLYAIIWQKIQFTHWSLSFCERS